MGFVVEFSYTSSTIHTYLQGVYIIQNAMVGGGMEMGMAISEGSMRVGEVGAWDK